MTVQSIAVVLPLYNGKKFLTETLESVVRQGRQPDEIVVVDDGSTDNGPELALAFSSRLPLRLLRKENGGQSSARNLGASKTRASHLAFLDQDDLWCPDFLERVAGAFDKDYGWVHSWMDTINENGRIIHAAPSSRDLIQNRDIIDCLSSNMGIMPSATIVSRKAFDAVGGFDERLCGYEDDDLLIRIMAAGFTHYCVPAALSRHRFHGGQTSKSLRMRKSAYIYCEKLMDAYPEMIRKIIAPRFATRLRKEFRRGLKDLNREALVLAIGHMQLLSDYNSSCRWTKLLPFKAV